MSTSHEAGRVRGAEELNVPRGVRRARGNWYCWRRGQVRSRTPDSCRSGSSCSTVQGVQREADGSAEAELQRQSETTAAQRQRHWAPARVLAEATQRKQHSATERESVEAMLLMDELIMSVASVIGTRTRRRTIGCVGGTSDAG